MKDGIDMEGDIVVERSMRENRKTKKFWPPVREATWWLLAGGVYGLFSMIPLVNVNVRENFWSSIHDLGGPILTGVVAGLLPGIWTVFLTSPLPHTRNLLYIAVPLSAILGSLAAYFLKALFNAWKRFSISGQ